MTGARSWQAGWSALSPRMQGPRTQVRSRSDRMRTNCGLEPRRPIGRNREVLVQVGPYYAFISSARRARQSARAEVCALMYIHSNSSGFGLHNPFRRIALKRGHFLHLSMEIALRPMAQDTYR